MQGIDFIHEGLSNFEKKLEHSIRKQPYCKDFLVETRSLIKGMKNTNSFMLMEINRFLDFTKASKGLVLQPKIDTIDLMETIALPLTCMKNIQDRITISLLPISPEIHNFILTDKHWLQENLLCLLSNAVQYSTEGLVTIKISLLHNSQQVAEQVKTLTTDSFSTNHPSTTIASTFRNQSDEFFCLKLKTLELE
jgi:signal transduction histidine kinase